MKDIPLLNPANWWSYIKDHRQQLLKQARIIVPYLLIYALMMFLLNYFEISTESVREYFGALGPVIIPLFILVQMICSLTPLPDLPFIAAGVLFFPPVFSFFLILIGMWLGGFVNFFIARRLGRGIVERRYPDICVWIDQFAGKYGFEAIIVARSFTFVTFDLVSYAAGISSIKFTKYAAASLISLLPVALNATLVGLALTSGNILRSIALVIFTSLLAVGLGWTARRYRLMTEIRNADRTGHNLVIE